VSQRKSPEPAPLRILASRKLPAMKKTGAHPKRAADADATGHTRLAPEVPQEVLAGPSIGIAFEPIDSPMWPIHSDGWLQPEAAALALSWSDLNIERRNRIPEAELLHFCLTPLNGFDGVDDRREILARAAPPGIPNTDLEPLGWDPRTYAPERKPR